MEQWRDILGYEGLYQVSNFGKVKSLDRFKKGKVNGITFVKGQIMKQEKHNGYTKVGLRKEGKRKNLTTHRLVARAFISNPENKPEVNHKNGIKDDNRVENLEWVTRSENGLHSYRVLGNITSEEERKRRSKSMKEKNLKRHATAIKVNVNGIDFKSLKEASLHFGKNDKYFSVLLRQRKTHPHYAPQWKIQLAETLRLK